MGLFFNWISRIVQFFLWTIVLFTFLSPLSLVLAKETAYQFQIGAEVGELANSKIDKFGSKNYSILFGQRFQTDKWSNFGWRFLAFDVLLTDKHLDAIIFVKGNTKDLEARQSIQRFYADYYFTGWKWEHLKLIPIASVGIGHSLITYTSPRSALLGYHFLGENYFLYREIALKDPMLGLLYSNSNSSAFFYNQIGYNFLAVKDKVTYSSPNIGLSYRFQFLFFESFFIEFQFDIARQNRRRKEWVGDTYLNFPEKTIAFTWVNLGWNINF